MPTITSNFVELLTYLAPGFVVLYGFRRQSDSVQKLIDAVTSGNGTPALLALLIIAIALGVIIAGVSMLTVPALARLTVRRNRKVPIHLRQLNLGRIYTHRAETLQVLEHHSRAYQATANMATAQLLSLGTLLYNLKWGDQPIDHWQFKIISGVIFVIAMHWASIRYFKFLYLLSKSLSVVRPKA